jgi:uncharacterized membrane protein
MSRHSIIIVVLSIVNLYNKVYKLSTSGDKRLPLEHQIKSTDVYDLSIVYASHVLAFYKMPFL